MKVESKFELKQRVFWLEANKVRSAVIQAIQFPRLYNDKSICVGTCKYFVSKSVKSSSVINWNGGGLYEKQIFESKKELLKSM